MIVKDIKKVLSCLKILSNNMSVFTKKLNPLTGMAEWVQQNEAYDFHQEIARSGFADMLHDKERNDKYYAAIKMVIEKTHNEGKKAHVLDIGTGTGLLAMMAARSGADTIYACEAFEPISQCAEHVIAENGLSDCITVVHKRSMEMWVGEDGDMPCRANILVTEVFDTELIGEGAISTFNHAHKHLLEKDCLVVPASGTIYAQVVDSDFLSQCNRLKSWTDIKPSQDISICPGAAAVHDVQLSQINLTDFRTITSPQIVFRFDWSSGTPIAENYTTKVRTEAVNSGTADLVFMWWSLDMDPQGQIVLSCAPWWAHHSVPDHPNRLPWRDHWMQAIYYLPAPVPVVKDQCVTLVSSHDEYSLWFNLTIDERPDKQDQWRPVCECMLHVACSRSRLGMLNDCKRRAKYLHVLKRLVSPETVALSWGDTSLLCLLTASLGAQKVYHVEENSISREVMEGLVKDNNLKSKINILSSSVLDKKVRSSVNLVLGEPFFTNILYPWDVLRWWYLRQQTPSTPCMPVAASLHAMVMQFDHLYKIRAPLGTISGFTMSAFDKLIEDSSCMSDSCVEVQPLWEYPGICLSQDTQLMNFDFNKAPPLTSVELTGNIPFACEGTCHGVSMWMEFQLDTDTVVSTGPQTPPTPSKTVDWDPYTRQAVYFLSPPLTVTEHSTLQYKVIFNNTTGEVNFHFN